jgi:hypothetical protein
MACMQYTCLINLVIHGQQVDIVPLNERVGARDDGQTQSACACLFFFPFTSNPSPKKRLLECSNALHASSVFYILTKIYMVYKRLVGG